MNSKNRTALAVAATAGVAAVALLAVLRADSDRRAAREASARRTQALQRWDYEGGNIPEVSLSSRWQGSTVERDEPGS